MQMLRFQTTDKSARAASLWEMGGWKIPVNSVEQKSWEHPGRFAYLHLLAHDGF
jgi:hypothetical protein